MFTIPKALRSVLQRDRKLLGLLAREAYRALSATFLATAPKEARVGMVGSLQTLGDIANWHPQIHARATAGVVLPGCEVIPRVLEAPEVHDRFRRGFLRAMVRAERLSPDFAEELSRWEHSGFSVFVGEPIPPQDARALLRLGRYR